LNLDVSKLSREDLLKFLIDGAKLWLAHDGVWFQAVERAYGLDVAMKLDAEAMGRFSAIEAKRIKARLGLPDGGGLDALDRALRHRLYSLINLQEVERPSEEELVFRMIECRVQAARRRKGLADFPCKPVGIVEYRSFAEAIDPRIEVSCITCPPDPHAEGCWCAWRFTVRSDGA